MPHQPGFEKPTAPASPLTASALGMADEMGLDVVSASWAPPTGMKGSVLLPCRARFWMSSA